MGKIGSYVYNLATNSFLPPAVAGCPITVNVVLAVTALDTVYFGLFPNRVLNFVLQSNLLGR